MCTLNNKIQYIKRCTLQDTDKASRLSLHLSTFACIKKRRERGEEGEKRREGEKERSLPKDLFYDFHAVWGLGTSLTFKISNYIHEIFVDIYLVSCLSPSGSYLKAPLGRKYVWNHHTPFQFRLFLHINFCKWQRNLHK